MEEKTITKDRKNLEAFQNQLETLEIYIDYEKSSVEIRAIRKDSILSIKKKIRK